jgi:hypothetical protein
MAEKALELAPDTSEARRVGRAQGGRPGLVRREEEYRRAIALSAIIYLNKSE